MSPSKPVSGTVEIPLVTSRETDFVSHDLAADGAEVLAGTFMPAQERVMIDVDSAFSMWGTARAALLLYVGQPDVAGSTLYDAGGKALPGTQIFSVAGVSGESLWASTSHRRVVLDVDPAKPVTWQVLTAIIGASGRVDVDAPSHIAITPDGTTAFITSPRAGTVTPVVLGRPGYSQLAGLRPQDEAQPPVATGVGPTHVSTDGVHVVVSNAGDVDNAVSILSATTFDVLHNVRLDGGSARSSAITRDGRHAVVGTSAGRVALIELASGSVTTVQIPGAQDLVGAAIALDGSAAFLCDSSSGSVYRIGLPSLDVEAEGHLDDHPGVVRVAPDGRVWVLCRPEPPQHGRLRCVDARTLSVVADYELPHAGPRDIAIGPVAEQTSDVVRTAWITFDEKYLEFYVGGAFAGLPHTIHDGAFAGDTDGPMGVAINDYGEIWVARPSDNSVLKWPGGRVMLRGGARDGMDLFWGEYCSVLVYGAKH